MIAVTPEPVTALTIIRKISVGLTLLLQFGDLLSGSKKAALSVLTKRLGMV